MDQIGYVFYWFCNGGTQWDITDIKWLIADIVSTRHQYFEHRPEYLIY